MTLAEAFKNSRGKVFYGMHFYPGVAQYDNDEGSFRVFVNEQTIRKMNPSFEARPVFVYHVEGVDDDLDIVRNEADGWVVESFFNEADGKTWAKFIIVSDRGLAAVRKGYKLSNAYVPQLVDTESTWNGVTYQKVVTGGEFEHLAIVENPRYEESVIMTPEEFKAYNSKLKQELIQLANSKDKKGEKPMALKLFQRKKLENAIDVENTMVELPKSKKEMTIAQLVNDHDAFLNMHGYASGDHLVKVNDKEEMSVSKLSKAYQAKCNELEEMQKNAKGDDGGEPGTGEDDIDPEVSKNDDGDGDEELDNEALEDTSADVKRDDNGDKSLDNEDEEAKDDDKKKNKKTKNAADKAAAKKIEDAKAAARLRNAHLNAEDNSEVVRVDLAEDQVARGKARYGSN